MKLVMKNCLQIRIGSQKHIKYFVEIKGLDEAIIFESSGSSLQKLEL